MAENPENKPKPWTAESLGPEFAHYARLVSKRKRRLAAEYAIQELVELENKARKIERNWIAELRAGGQSDPSIEVATAIWRAVGDGVHLALLELSVDEDQALAVAATVRLL